MKAKLPRRASWMLMAVAIALPATARPAAAQAAGWFWQMRQHCLATRGRWVPTGNGGYRCVYTSVPAPPPPPQPPPAPYQTNQEQERQQEQQRQANAREQARAKAQARADEQRRKAEQHAQFLRSRDEAYRHLKKVGLQPPGLKGEHGNTATFGLKGISSAQASILIDTLPPDRQARQAETAWQQLHCAAVILGDAARAASSDLTGPALDQMADNVRYLAQQAAAALDGRQVGVACDSGGPMPTIGDPAQATSQVRSLSAQLLNNVNRLQRLDSRARKIEQNSTRPVATGAPANRSLPENAEPAAAPAAGNIAQHDRALALKAYAVQRQNTNQQNAALALLLATQRELNSIRAEKEQSRQQIQRIAAQLQALHSSPRP